MIGPDLSRVAVYVRPGATDMRKAVNGLSIIVAEQMESDPLCGALYMFCNRERRILKGLWWDRNGYCLLYKRLHRALFRLPGDAPRVGATMQLEPAALAELLAGVAHERATRSRRLH